MTQSADSILASIEEYNKDIKKWAYQVRGKLATNIRNSTTEGNGVLAAKVRSKLHKDLGEIDSVSYQFPRHGVFFQKGVGRGHVMSGGMVVRGLKDGKTIRYLAKDHGKVSKPLNPNHVTRTPQDWFNSTLDNELPKLADIVADHKADEAVVNANGMKIN